MTLSKARGDTQAVEAWVDDWYTNVVSPWAWKRADNQAGALKLEQGEAGGFMVSCPELGDRRAYLKPIKKEEGAFCSRAAREKIVSDLARLVGVSVPPVLLYESDLGPQDSETNCCVSLVMYPAQYSWKDVAKYLIDASLNTEVHQIFMTDLPSAAARALVLDAWVLQPDHGDHPHNMIFGHDPKDPKRRGFVFLDYAFALGHSWVARNHFRALGWKCWSDSAGWEVDVDIPYPPLMERYLQREEIQATLERIAQIKSEEIENIVERIPDAYMSAAERSSVVLGLEKRRELLPDLSSIAKFRR
ncbi:MAG: hypothetical protein AB7K71_29135 [Polyangiaceae bacterium]